MSYKIINEGGISAVSGQGVIVNLKLKRTLIAFLLRKKSNIMLESETPLSHKVIFKNLFSCYKEIAESCASFWVYTSSVDHLAKDWRTTGTITGLRYMNCKQIVTEVVYRKSLDCIAYLPNSPQMHKNKLREEGNNPS